MNRDKRREEGKSRDARTSGHASQNGTNKNPPPAAPRSFSGPTPEDWARLLRVDPLKLDLNPARDRALQRLTKPFAMLILAVGYGMGVLLAWAGLDVARLTGTNAFGLFLLEAAFNGIAVMVLSAPLWFFALATPTAAVYRRRVLQWITADEAERARTYLRMVEGKAGLIWRFAADRRHQVADHEQPTLEYALQAPDGFLVAPRLWEGEGSAMEAMLEASWTGDFNGIDLDLYWEAVEALQYHAVHVPAGPPYGERPVGDSRSAGRSHGETVATPGNEPVAKNSDLQAPEVNFSDTDVGGFLGRCPQGRADR